MKASKWQAGCILVVVVVVLVAWAGAGKHKEVSLPGPVKAAIEALYPQATIEESELEEEGIKVYEVELEQEGKEVELTIAPDGTVMEKESEVALSDVPAAVQAAIVRAAEGAEIDEVTEEVTYWVVTLKKLEAPQTTYEAEVIKDGKETEIEVGADGSIVENDDEDNGREHKCEKDDEDDD
jgi:hypothetical protein